MSIIPTFAQFSKLPGPHRTQRSFFFPLVVSPPVERVLPLLTRGKVASVIPQKSLSPRWKHGSGARAVFVRVCGTGLANGCSSFRERTSEMARVRAPELEARAENVAGGNAAGKTRASVFRASRAGGRKGGISRARGLCSQGEGKMGYE